MLLIYNPANSMTSERAEGWTLEEGRERGERTDTLPTRALRWLVLPQRPFLGGHIGCTRRSMFAGRIELLGGASALAQLDNCVHYVRKAHCPRPYE